MIPLFFKIPDAPGSSDTGQARRRRTTQPQTNCGRKEHRTLLISNRRFPVRGCGNPWGRPTTTLHHLFREGEDRTFAPGNRGPLGCPSRLVHCVPTALPTGSLARRDENGDLGRVRRLGAPAGTVKSRSRKHGAGECPRFSQTGPRRPWVCESVITAPFTRPGAGNASANRPRMPVSNQINRWRCG